MVQPTVLLRVAPDLRFLLRRARRSGPVLVPSDGTSTIGHLVESVGVPRTEVGGLVRAGRPVSPALLPRAGDVIDVLAIVRPQALAQPRFLLDVHLGALARRLRLVGVDAAYGNDAGDARLVAQAVSQRRVLLTQDRGLLRRRALPAGAYVRGDQPDRQLDDVLDRFAVALAPWTRCLTCNGLLEPVRLDQVAHLLKPGTMRSYTEFAHCADCGQVYWRGAHARRLDAIVKRARAAETAR